MRFLFSFLLFVHFAHANPGQLGVSSIHDHMNEDMMMEVPSTII
jgi:hypothetical protein